MEKKMNTKNKKWITTRSGKAVKIKYLSPNLSLAGEIYLRFKYISIH